MKFLPRSAAALVVAALFPVLVAAQQSDPQGPPRGRGGMRAAQAGPQAPNQLTEQQREQVRALHEQHRQAVAQARDDLRAKLSSILTAEQRQAFRGRELGQLFGSGGGRGGVTARPGGARGAVMARPRGGRGAIAGPAGRGGGRGGIVMQRRQAPGRQGRDDVRLRAEIRRLEAHIEALRRRIR